jgi:small conductance mechanosensitive channel
MSYLINWVISSASQILYAVILTAIGLLIIRIVLKAISAMLEKSKLEKAAHSLIKTLARTVMLVLLGLIVASSLGIDVTGIVALASVASLAISLALQNMLANVIGGFTLLYTHPFGAGDYVEIAGKSGTVKEVGIAYTKLLTPDKKLISIPNSSVVATDIVNYSCCEERRVDIAISASYDAPVAKVEAALAQAIQVPGVLEDPAPFISVTSYGDSAINYVVRVWVKNADYWDVHFAITHKIKEVFDAQGIEMTYPHLNVHLDK